MKMPSHRVYFDVPFAQKDQAKACGARWDVHRKMWFAPDGPAAAPLRPLFAVIVPRAPIKSPKSQEPLVLVGEDRSFGGDALFVDLVPQSCWFTNVRYCLAPNDWHRLSLLVRHRAGNCCEICGASEDPSKKIYLEAHERWAFDETTSTQSLRRIIALCKACHQTTHWGLARIKRKEAKVLAHLRAVNGWSELQALAHVAEAFRIWRVRSQRSWALDLSVITASGLAPAQPPSPAERSQIANTQ